MSYQLIRVPPESPVELKRRVYRLRHAIYVKEKRYPLSAEDGLLTDEFGERSTNLLAVWDGQDIGTLRHTARRGGPLEAERQCSAWAHTIATRPRESVCELTRLMITKKHRAKAALPFLLWGATREWELDGIVACFAAARVKAPTRLWRGYSAQIANEARARYSIQGYDLASDYQLLRFEPAVCREVLRKKLQRFPDCVGQLGI